MNINSKIKLLAETFTGYSVTVDSSNGANVELSKLAMPCILVFIQENGEYQSTNSHYRDSVNIKIALLNKINKGFKDEDVNAMRHDLKADAVLLYHRLKFDFEFKVNSDAIKYEIVYDEFDDSLMGVTFSDTIKERVGINLACEQIESIGSTPSAVSFCERVSECSSIVSINTLLEDLQNQIDNLPTGGVLSGLTTNRVLKASSPTTAVDSNITDDSTSITISSPNNQNLVVVEDNNLYIQYSGTTNAGGLTYLNTYVDLQHDARVNLNAPSVTKNGVEVATENYVDNLIAGLKFKLDVVAASIANVNISSAPSTLDGVTLTSGDRVLLKNQTTQSQNGCYIFNGTGSAMTRATDSDTGAELVSATYPVRGGSTNQDTWFTVTNDSITLGSTNIIITQTAGSGIYTVGSYLKLIGNVFDIDFTTFSTTQITEGTKLFFTDARVLTAPLTGFASAAGTITAADTILSAINKLNGNLDSKTLFKSTTDSLTHTGTLTNTIIWSEDISNKLSSGDIADLISDVVRVSGSTSASIRYYLNSSASLSGATQIGHYIYGFSGTNIANFRRELIVKSSTSIRVKGTVFNMLNDLSVFGSYADVTVNLASLYVIFAITLGNTGDKFLVSSRKMVR